MESGGYPATSARHNTQSASEPNDSNAPQAVRQVPPTAYLGATVVSRQRVSGIRPTELKAEGLTPGRGRETGGDGVGRVPGDLCTPQT